MSLIHSLREATAPIHKQLDTNPIFAKLLARRLTLAEYCGLLQVYYTLYGAFERDLYQRHDLQELLPDLHQRRKAHLLANDLEDLGALPPSLVGHAHPHALLATRSEALGCLYVLEGSTLGGRVLRKSIVKTFGFQDGRGCSFLGSYGDQIDERWQDFIRAMTSYSFTPDEMEAAKHAAISTFKSFISGLNSLETIDAESRRSVGQMR